MTTLAYIVGSYYLGNTNTANTTTFATLAGNTLANQVTEANVQTRFRDAGNFTNLLIRVIANTCSATTTCTLRDNSVSVNNTVSILTGQTSGEFEDTTPHTDTITAGHDYNLTVVPAGGSTGVVTISVIRTLFNTTTNTATRLVCSNGNAITAVSTTYYNVISGVSGTTNTTEAPAKCRQLLAGTMNNMMAEVSANSRTTTTTVNSRLNGGNGATTISILTLATGIKEDVTLTNADTISVNDDYCTAYTVGNDSSKSITFRNIAVTFVSTAGYTQCSVGDSIGLVPIVTVARFIPISGRYYNSGTTESQVQMKAGETKKFTNLTIVLSAQSGTGTVNFRKNAGNGVQTVSVTGTGAFTDTTNVDYVISTDEVNYAFSAGATTGNTVNSLSSWAFGKAFGLAETTTISEVIPKRKIGRLSKPVFTHT